MGEIEMQNLFIICKQIIFYHNPTLNEQSRFAPALIRARHLFKSKPILLIWPPTTYVSRYLPSGHQHSDYWFSLYTCPVFVNTCFEYNNHVPPLVYIAPSTPLVPTKFVPSNFWILIEGTKLIYILWDINRNNYNSAFQWEPWQAKLAILMKIAFVPSVSRPKVSPDLP